MLIDTHAHLNFKAFEKDLDQVIAQAKRSGVGKIINVGARLDSSIKAVELAQAYEGLFAAVGFHPHHADEFENRGLTPKGVKPLEQLELLARNPKVVAIGETGLDYHEYISRTKPGIADRNTQERVFLKHLSLAKKLNLAVIIHSRESIRTLLPLVAQLKKGEFGDLRGVFHCWSEEIGWAKKVLDLGFYLSFTPIITYPKNDYLREVVRIIPLESILVETDSPFLPPQEKRGLRNTPETAKIVAATIAEIKNISFSKIEEVTTNNAKRLFKCLK